MANTKSAEKNIRKTARQTERNRTVRSRLKTLAKKAGAEGEEGQQAAREYISALDKAAKRGIISANKASRHKSKLSGKISAAA